MDEKRFEAALKVLAVRQFLKMDDLVEKTMIVASTVICEELEASQKPQEGEIVTLTYERDTLLEELEFLKNWARDASERINRARCSCVIAVEGIEKENWGSSKIVNTLTKIRQELIT